MLAISHALTGAVIGASTENAAVSFPVAIFAHFLMDKIPHFWPSEKLWKGIIGGLDWFVAFLIILGLFYFNPFHNLAMAWGALGGAMVDFTIIGIPWLHKGALGKWHTNRQPHHVSPLYLISDFLLIGLTLAILFIVK